MIDCRSSMAALTVVVPCLNEAASLPELVRRIDAALAGLFPPGGFELILIDDGSTDGTWAVIEALARACSFVRSVRHGARRGIPAAWRSGVAAATGAWTCVLDADLQYEPEEIPRLWRARQETGADIVQGARAAAGRGRDARLLMSRGLNSVLNGVFGMSLRDNKSGFFLCRRETFARLLGFRERYRHWQCFVMVAAHHHGFRIHQLETPFHPRRAGRSAFGRVGLGPALGVALDLFAARREYGRGAP